MSALTSDQKDRLIAILLTTLYDMKHMAWGISDMPCPKCGRVAVKIDRTEGLKLVCHCCQWEIR